MLQQCSNEKAKLKQFPCRDNLFTSNRME
jgi:hypothetical protein